MVTIREEKIADVAAREALLDVAYGAMPFRQDVGAAARRPPAGGRACRSSPSSAAAIIGTVRLWHVTAGPGRRRCCSARSRSHPDYRNRGIGTTLMRRAIARARLAGHRRRPAGRRCALLRPLRLHLRRRPAACGCPAASTATGSWRSNCSRRRSPARAA